ncbi:thioesterase family protein [Colwellia sp. MEBiC06753]
MNIGDKVEIDYTVLASDSAKSLSLTGDDDFPEVFATSRMIALMELAAARLMKALLKDDELSVGVNVNVNHLAATLVGAKVTAIAEFTGMENSLFQFKVELHDAGGVAGSGSHSRGIISTERLLAGASKRCAS